MSTDTTREVFSATAATYDPARARLIPCFEKFYRTVVDRVPPHADHILDLGAGTGLLSAFLRVRFEDARLHLIDNAAAMLAQAEQRFRHDQEVLCQLGDYTTAQWGGDYDAVVSALSIHHLTDDGKQQLFAKIHASLKPGGVFLNAEQILAPTPALEAQAKADWLAEVRALGATEDQIAASLLRQTEDRCATIDDQLRWMYEAGFADPRCVFHQGRFAVLLAKKIA